MAHGVVCQLRREKLKTICRNISLIVQVTDVCILATFVYLLSYMDDELTSHAVGGLADFF